MTLWAESGVVLEALAISVDDVDIRAGTVTIQHLKARTNLSCSHCGSRLSKSHFFCPGCGKRVRETQQEQRERHRMRTIPIDPESLDMLRQYIHKGGPVERGDRYLLFGISRSRAWQVVRCCAQKAGIGPLLNPETGRIHSVSPHRLRDAFAVMAVRRNDSNDSIRMLQEQLGHASIATTMRYRKVAGEDLRAWYDRLWQDEGHVEGPPA